MTTALDKTFQLLSASSHSAVDGLLLSALDSLYARDSRRCVRRSCARARREIVGSWPSGISSTNAGGRSCSTTPEHDQRAALAIVKASIGDSAITPATWPCGSAITT